MSDIEKIAEWLGSGSINIFGTPYAGKDTQGGHLARDLNTVRLSGGEILRNSDIPPHVKKAIDSGVLAPTKDYIDIVVPYLSQQQFTGKPLVLSSVGRWKGEEEGVIEALKAAGHELKAVILLDISESTVRERFNAAVEIGDRGERADDEEHLLDIRLKEYREKTLPVLEFYEQMELLDRIDGQGAIENTYAQIIAKLLVRAGS